MDADLGTLHAPEAAAEVVDEGCRRVRERGQIDIVRSATCVDTDDKRMAIRRTADIGARRSLVASSSGHLSLSIRLEAAVFWRMRKAFWRAHYRFVEGKSERLPEFAAGPSCGSTGFGDLCGPLTRTRQAIALPPRCANSWDNPVPEPTRGADNRLTRRRLCMQLMSKPMSWPVADASGGQRCTDKAFGSCTLGSFYFTGPSATEDQRMGR